MGLTVSRILHAFEGPFKTIPYGELQSPVGNFPQAASATGYVLDSRSDPSFVAVNDLLRAGVAVYRFTNEKGEKTVSGQGSFYIPANAKAKMLLAKAWKSGQLPIW